MPLSAKHAIVLRTELINMSVQLSCVIKSLRFVKEICEGVSEPGSDPLHRLDIAGLILQDKIDDLDTVVRNLNQQVTRHSIDADEAA